MPSPSSDRQQSSMPFPATSWTRVMRYQGGDERAARTALEDLCRVYWQPVVNYFKALGCDEQAAQDTAQEFLSQFAAPGQGFDRIDRDKGRLRAYLKQAARHFLSKTREKARAQRRGGGAEVLPIDEHEPEPEEEDADTASVAYDRSWAMTVLESAFGRLRQDYAGRGKASLFDAIRPCLLEPDDGGESCLKLAGEFHTSTASMSLEIHRTRKRLARRLRDEVLATVETEVEADEEVRYLLRILAYGGE